MYNKDEIRTIAYRLWQEENCCHGHDVEHWLKAEIICEKGKKQEAAIIEPEKALKRTTKQPIPKPSAWGRK